MARRIDCTLSGGARTAEKRRKRERKRERREEREGEKPETLAPLSIPLSLSLFFTHCDMCARKWDQQWPLHSSAQLLKEKERERTKTRDSGEKKRDSTERVRVERRTN